MKFDIDITKVEARDGLGQPPVSGTYLLAVTEWIDFTADSGSQGVNIVCRVIKTEKPDTEKYHGSFARATLWATEKGMPFLRGWLDTVKVPYTAHGINDADTIGKVFWGRLKCYVDPDGYDKQDLVRWEAPSEEMMKYAAPFVLEWTGADKPPEKVGSGVSVKKPAKKTAPETDAAKSDNAEEVEDEDIPF